jgi:hypothetical protein
MNRSDVCRCGHPKRVHVYDRCDGLYKGVSNGPGLCECYHFMSETSPKNEIGLGSGVTLRWIHKDEPANIVGASICHERSGASPHGQCCGYISLRGKDPSYTGATWEFDGDYNKPTLLPSVLCSCGFHGYVKDGNWINA